MSGSGRVISVEGNKAKVQVTTSASCGGCAAKGYCHGSSENSKRILTAINRIEAQPGDLVSFEADAKRVVFSALLVWLLPLAAMVVGYFAGEMIAGGIVPIIAAFVFLAISLIILKLIDTSAAGGSAFYPIITSIITDPSAVGHPCG